MCILRRRRRAFFPREAAQPSPRPAAARTTHTARFSGSARHQVENARQQTGQQRQAQNDEQLVGQRRKQPEIEHLILSNGAIPRQRVYIPAPVGQAVTGLHLGVRVGNLVDIAFGRLHRGFALTGAHRTLGGHAAGRSGMARRGSHFSWHFLQLDRLRRGHRHHLRGFARIYGFFLNGGVLILPQSVHFIAGVRLRRSGLHRAQTVAFQHGVERHPHLIHGKGEQMQRQQQRTGATDEMHAAFHAPFRQHAIQRHGGDQKQPVPGWRIRFLIDQHHSQQRHGAPAHAPKAAGCQRSQHDQEEIKQIPLRQPGAAGAIHARCVQQPPAGGQVQRHVQTLGVVLPADSAKAVWRAGNFAVGAHGQPAAFDLDARRVFRLAAARNQLRLTVDIDAAQLGRRGNLQPPGAADFPGQTVADGQRTAVETQPCLTFEAQAIRRGVAVAATDFLERQRFAGAHQITGQTPPFHGQIGLLRIDGSDAFDRCAANRRIGLEDPGLLVGQQRRLARRGGFRIFRTFRIFYRIGRRLARPVLLFVLSALFTSPIVAVIHCISLASNLFFSPLAGQRQRLDRARIARNQRNVPTTRARLHAQAARLRQRRRQG